MPRGHETRIRDRQLIDCTGEHLLIAKDCLFCTVNDRVLAKYYWSRPLKQKERHRELRRSTALLYERLLSRQPQFGALHHTNQR
jgi:hypothetical protein